MTYPQASDSYNYMPRLNKATAKERALKVAKGLRRHKGSAASLAKELGVTRQAVQKKKNNPEFQSLRMQAISKACQRHGITEDLVYGKLRDGFDATLSAAYLGNVQESDVPDRKEIREHIKIGLELFGHINTDIKEDSKPTEIHVHYGHRTKPPQKEDDGST